MRGASLSGRAARDRVLCFSIWRRENVLETRISISIGNGRFGGVGSRAGGDEGTRKRRAAALSATGHNGGAFCFCEGVFPKFCSRVWRIYSMDDGHQKRHPAVGYACFIVLFIGLLQTFSACCSNSLHIAPQFVFVFGFCVHILHGRCSQKGDGTGANESVDFSEQKRFPKYSAMNR